MISRQAGKKKLKDFQKYLNNIEDRQDTISEENEVDLHGIEEIKKSLKFERYEKMRLENSKKIQT